MRSPHTLVAKTRDSIFRIYNNAMTAWAHGETIDTAAVLNEVDKVLDDMAEEVRRRVAEKDRLEK
jgi:hypothetical protein